LGSGALTNLELRLDRLGGLRRAGLSGLSVSSFETGGLLGGIARAPLLGALAFFLFLAPFGFFLSAPFGFFLSAPFGLAFSSSVNA
jgi:hypothetical protein